MNAIQTYEGGKLAAVQGSGCCCAPPSSGGAMGRMMPRWLGGRRGLILGAVAIGGAGLAFGWPTLVALGIAPILVSLAPCAVMCALGLCVMGKGRQAVPAPAAVPMAPVGEPVPMPFTAEAPDAAPDTAYAREPARLA